MGNVGRQLHVSKFRVRVWVGHVGHCFAIRAALHVGHVGCDFKAAKLRRNITVLRCVGHAVVK